MSDTASERRLLCVGGFQDVQVRTVSRTIRFDDDASLVRLNAMALVGMSSAGKAISNEERKRMIEAIVSESLPVIQSYVDGSELAFELSTNLATAKR